MDIFKIVNKNDCCGCGSCYQSCTHNAINMVDEGYGFKFPHVNNNVCVNCGVCVKSCPLQKIEKNNPLLCYASTNKDEKIRLKSSSGGLFYEFSKYIIEKLNGVVFGAKFDENFNVVMDYTTTMMGVNDFMRSKYVQADTNKTFYNCKRFLEEGKYVLYTGTPCQINGLKSFLKKEYDKLYTIDIACHGVPSQKVWVTYVKKLKNKYGDIESINFRDKKNGWKEYNFTVKFKSGFILSERHNSNEFMNLFLKDKILRRSCYSCKFKNIYSKSDLTIGDFWSINDFKKELNDNKGISAIVANTQKGKDLLELVDINKYQCNYNVLSSHNGGFKNEIKLPPDRIETISKYTKKQKIGVVTLPLHTNIGGILQAYALQQYLIKQGFDVELIEKNNSKHLYFVEKYIKRKIIKESFYKEIKQNEYDTLIVGSDQIWRIKYSKYLDLSFLGFAKDWKNINKIAYSCSFGADSWEYSESDTEKAKELIKYIKIVSIREDNGVDLCKKYLQHNATHTCDPTMLLTRQDYIQLLNKEGVKQKENGIFTYILDKSKEKEIVINNASKILNKNIMKFNQTSVIDWLNSFYSCNCVITDSFHGCVFSIIFNKPFICILNTSRGIGRFKSLMNTFKTTKDRFFKNCKDVNYELLTKDLNINDELNTFIKSSAEFLNNALK